MGTLIGNPSLHLFLPQREVDPTDPEVALLTIAEYRDALRDGNLNGFGHPVTKAGDTYYEDRRFEIETTMKGADLPSGATHVHWIVQ